MMYFKEPTKTNGEAEETVKRPNRGTNPSPNVNRQRRMRRGYKL